MGKISPQNETGKTAGSSPKTKSATGVPTVTIYSASWCAFCKAEKKFLDAHHITYTDIDVDTMPDAAHRLFELSGQMGIPFTIITQADGKYATILGFDQPALETALGLT